jgi:hypothetical protein
VKESARIIVRACLSSAVPLDRLDVSPEARELLQRSLFFEPLPFVHRIVFIATPHRGSYLAGGRISNLLRKVISLPFTMTVWADQLVKYWQ